MDTETLLDFSVVRATRAEMAAVIVSWIEHGDRCRYLSCLNPHTYVVSLTQERAASAYRAAHWLIADGIGIVWASRLLHGKVPERVTGSDIFYHVLNALESRGSGRLFFLGSTPGTLARIAERIRRDYPSLTVAGTWAPAFGDAISHEETDRIVATINAARAEILWVGMTAPKQDIWLYSNCSALNVRFGAGIGAVFDFYSGNVKRPGPVFQRLGLEWLPRLLKDWRRLWRRTLVSAPRFVWCVLKERFSMSIRSARSGGRPN